MTAGERSVLWRTNNPEKQRVLAAASNAAYYARHREKELARKAADRLARPEIFRTRDAAYSAAHPEKRREKDHRRRARERNQFVAPVDARAIYVRDKGQCHICGKKVQGEEASMDHLNPISLGGAHAPWNVALAHRLCNVRRGNRGPAQTFLAWEYEGLG